MDHLRMMIACGVSMAPQIKPGEAVLVDPNFPRLSLRVGDIVLVENTESGASLLHRIIKLDSSTLEITLKGDRNSLPDLLSSDWRYSGKLMWILRQGIAKAPPEGIFWAWMSRSGLFPGQRLPRFFGRTYWREKILGS